MRVYLLAITGVLVSCIIDTASQQSIERAGQGVAQCPNILNDTQGIYKNGNLLTFVVRGRDPSCRYILKDGIIADTVDAAYYRGSECQEHFSNAYVFFRYKIFTSSLIKISISDGVQGVSFGLGGGTYETLDKLSLLYSYEININDSFPEYSCSP